MRKVNLVNLEKEMLTGKEMRTVFGGTAGECCCGCWYADSGGSSVLDNHNSNTAGGVSSPDCYNLPEIVVVAP